MGKFSFGFKSAAVATLVLLIASAFFYFNLGTHSGMTTTPNVTATNANQTGSAPVNPTSTVATIRSEAVGGSEVDKKGVVEPDTVTGGEPDRLSIHRHGLTRSEVAVRRDDKSKATRDLSSTQAEVIKQDQFAEAYQTAAFPIDAGYQSLKVSVNDGRGSSRTISLPAVSFGSQSALSQNVSPLMASARETW